MVERPIVERRRAQRALVRTRETAPAPIFVQPGFDSHPTVEAPARKQEGRRKSKGPLPLMIVNGLLLAMCGYAALSATLPSKTVPRSFLGLSVAHTDTGLKLLWNASSTALRGVTEAELTITDGEHRSQLLLSPGQIRRGNLFYVPFTGEVRFNLRVQGSNRAANETVLALNQPTATKRKPQITDEPTALQGAVTFPTGTSPEVMSNLTAAKPAHVQ